MKPHHILLSTLALGFTEARTVPGYTFPPSNSSGKPSGLNWKTCDFDFPKSMKDKMTFPADCATLKVPLDYTSLSTGREIDLNLFRIKATKSPFKGSILYNPGGPGESAIQSVIGSHPDFMSIFDGHYNIIGFDPRGTGRTIPFKCEAPNSTNSSQSTHSRRNDVSFPLGNPWPHIKKEEWETNKARADLCYESQREYGSYIGSAATARDMLSIVDALNEDGKLRYWGTSYGTTLGQIFASMFPDRIARMILDSNLPADDYLTNAWSVTAQDTERSFDKFLEECVIAGPELCRPANFSGSETKPEQIKTAIKDIFEALLDTPTLPEDSGLSTEEFPHGGPDVERELKSVIYNQLYSPLTWSKLANITTHLLARNWAKALEAGQGAQADSDEEPWHLGTLATYGIRCSDSSFRVETPDDLYSLTQLHLSYGSFAEGNLRLECAQWRFDAAEKVDTNNLRNVKTSFPILFVNSPYDPITPLIGAWASSARFRESRVVVHEGVGHSFTAHPSNCTNEIVRRYFDDGEMPEVGTVCKPNLPVYEFLAEQSKS
ncbi:Tripeptidyl aminopeptidase [Fusarium albosuccineum]|uniref:Tripeptidyl aminopeptidase n=1 Tax=Fusarium albosuccineum TaxID=1237068 RepID=A0A8H4LEJ5_9HYPO|nr:Tripeptidyl aminopeptidase [Fusarium albosuccineum]